MASDAAGVRIIQGLLNTGPGIIFKWFEVIGMVMYCIFALVVIKQVGIMAETFESEVNGTVKTFAWLHFFLAGFLAGLAIWL